MASSRDRFVMLSRLTCKQGVQPHSTVAEHLPGRGTRYLGPSWAAHCPSRGCELDLPKATLLLFNS